MCVCGVGVDMPLYFLWYCQQNMLNLIPNWFQYTVPSHQNCQFVFLCYIMYPQFFIQLNFVCALIFNTIIVAFFKLHIFRSDVQQNLLFMFLRSSTFYLKRQVLKAPPLNSLGLHIWVFQDRSERRAFNLFKKALK